MTNLQRTKNIKKERWESNIRLNSTFTEFIFLFFIENRCVFETHTCTSTAISEFDVCKRKNYINDVNNVKEDKPIR